MIALIALSTQAPVFPENRIQQDVDGIKMKPLIVTSVDDLVGGFRVQQVSMSSTMLNVSRKLGLPEKIAKAEVEEAEQRSAKAYRGKNEARTPFIASTSMYNLGYIGRGYDIYRGNPLSDDGVVDQGFRLPVIDLPFSFRFTSDGEFRIPDNVDVISETSASFGSSFYSVKSESDYQSMLTADASVNAHAGGYGLSGSFSASFSYQKQKREIEKGETTSVNIVGRSIVYRARLSSTAHISKVSDYFENAIIALPMENCEEEVIQELYTEVLREFGTHYATEVVMGAKAVQSLEMKNSDLDKMAAEGISAKVAAQLSYSGFGFSAGGGFSAGFSNNEKSRNRVQNTDKKRKEYYIGGNPPSGDFSEGSTQSLREWARSASEKPVPIQYKLSSIDELIMPDYFRRLTYGFYERRRCLRQALVRFCRQSISPRLCNSQGDEERGLKRRKRQANRKTPIQFGDFVTLRNKNNFLVLGEKFGFATGAATKPFVLSSQIKYYDGLFQIMPVDEQSEKLQTDLDNGEPFLLRTVKGDEIFTGRLHVPDLDMPSSTSLMDLYGNKDDKKSSKTFTVRVEGEEGSVETIFKVNTATCSISPYNRYRYKCHRLFVADDIGEVKRAQITGMYRGVTDTIKEIEVKIVFDGEKRRYSKTGLRCTGNNYVTPRLNPDGKKRVDCNIVLFPDETGRLSSEYVEYSAIIISFDVTSMVNEVEMRTTGGSYQIDLLYVDRNSDTFQKIDSSAITTQTTNNVKTLKLKEGMYASAIKLFTGTRNVSQTILIDTVSVMGCPGAIYETGSDNKEDLEWVFQLSENEIQTYPYLGVVSNKDEKYDLDYILKNLDRNITDRVSYSIPVDSSCSYDSETILSKLRTENEMTVVKFESARVTRNGNILNVELVIVSLNQRERDMAMLHLENEVTTVVRSIQCVSDQISLGLNDSGTSKSTASIAVISVLSILLAVMIALIIGLFIHRRKKSPATRNGKIFYFKLCVPFHIT
ncbi:hypothetical protein FSP39_004322 [Pinctada imbricata]|uniref:MACPF domain-containing protein n=1 Tax=Pinctada imbricata TaxID=66713 RepID=A0AA88YPU1_PINIB|nr:hypothetical protein FSP39_004322 [Pinctada imbricata]